MVELMQGDILHADAEALVNTVNCVGIMGRGVALQFRKAFPDNYKFYKRVCEHHELRPGRMLVYETGRLTNPRYVINFPTKRHWKGKSRIEDIDAGLTALIDEVRHRRIRSIAIPPLGSGLGGLRWNDVRPRIMAAFDQVPNVRVMLYEPIGAPEPSIMAKDLRKPNMTAGRAVLLKLIQRYLAVLMDPFVTLLEIHKLMYFMQAAGEPLRLKYQKGVYGPYAQNLRHVLSIMEGYLIKGYGDADDKPGRPIELLPEAAELADEFLQGHETTHERVGRVSRLIHGFETPHGMELLATVHWVAVQEGARSSDEAVKLTYNWNDRKRLFSEKQIRMAWKRLQREGWLPEETN